MRRIPIFQKILMVAAAIVLCTWVTAGVMAQPASTAEPVVAGDAQQDKENSQIPGKQQPQA